MILERTLGRIVGRLGGLELVRPPTDLQPVAVEARLGFRAGGELLRPLALDLGQLLGDLLGPSPHPGDRLGQPDVLELLLVPCLVELRLPILQGCDLLAARGELPLRRRMDFPRLVCAHRETPDLVRQPLDLALSGKDPGVDRVRPVEAHRVPAELVAFAIDEDGSARQAEPRRERRHALDREAARQPLFHERSCRVVGEAYERTRAAGTASRAYARTALCSA